MCWDNLRMLLYCCSKKMQKELLENSLHLKFSFKFKIITCGLERILTSKKRLQNRSRSFPMSKRFLDPLLKETLSFKNKTTETFSVTPNTMMTIITSPEPVGKSVFCFTFTNLLGSFISPYFSTFSRFTLLGTLCISCGKMDLCTIRS